MTQDYKESLSAMMDGEANELELQRTLKNASEDDMAAWSRYQTASSFMKKDKDLFFGADISAAVSNAIANEAPLKRKGISGAKPILSFAVAATVTLAVFAGLQLQQTESGFGTVSSDIASTAGSAESTPVFAGGQGLSLQSEQGFATVSGELQLETSNTQRAVADSIAADRLNAHIEAHTESSSNNNNEGVLPFARVEAATE